MQFTQYHPQFFTATNLEWKPLLKEGKHKDIVINSLRFLVKNNGVKIYSFVIMPNHLHLIWQIQAGHERQNVQRDFLKFTAQQIRFNMQVSNIEWLKEFEVNAKDRKYQFWERNPLSVDLYTESVWLQKIEYVHNNPAQKKWELCILPEAYDYSSALFYHTGIDNWGFLNHWRN